ncbi:MAG: hypothetical protein AB1921_07280 [Thermodesulfobacteriota bacterium]
MRLHLLEYLPLAAGLAFAAMAAAAAFRRRPVLLPVSLYYLLLSVPVFAMAAVSVYRSLTYSQTVTEARFLLFALCAYALAAVVMARRSGQFMALGVDGGDFLEALAEATGFRGEIPEDGRVPAGQGEQRISVHVHPGLQAAQAGVLPGPEPAEAVGALSRLAEALSRRRDGGGVWGFCLILPTVLSVAAAVYVHREIAAMDGAFWMGRALSFAAQENFTAAAFAAERAVEKAGDTEERALGLWGHALAAKGETGRAAEVFSRLLAMNPADPEALAYAGRFFATAVRPPDPGKGAALARRAVQLSPSCVPCMDALAVSLAAAGRFPEAVKIQKELLRLLTAQGAEQPVLEPMQGRLSEYGRRAGNPP